MEDVFDIPLPQIVQIIQTPNALFLVISPNAKQEFYLILRMTFSRIH